MKKELEKIIAVSIKYSDSKGDQKDFYTMVEYAAKTPRVEEQPPLLEIGTRGGGSALALLKIIDEFYGANTVLVTVDPYGEKPYDGKPWKYGDKLCTQMKEVLAPYGNHIHYQMTSEEFLKIIDKIHYWHGGVEKDFSQFSFIFLDGSHLPETIISEYKSLFPRLIKGGYIVIDNTDFYSREVQKYFKKSTDKLIEVINTKDQTIIKKL